MIVLEAFLAAIILVLLFDASFSDLKTGKIPNKSILRAVLIGTLAIVPYYAFFASDCLAAYGVNNLLTVVICLLLYATGIWGAGDCKFLCAIIFLFPARLYCLDGRSLASSFLLIALVFISAFIYVFGETIYLGIKRGDLMGRTKMSFNIKSYLRGFFFYFLFLNLLHSLFAWIVPGMLLEDAILLTAFHFSLLLIAMQLEPKVSWGIIGLMALLWVGMLLTKFTRFSFSGIDWKTYIVAFLLIVYRSVAEKYNYQNLEVEELRPGMILSFVTIMMFMGSKVQGLPTSTTEDLKSRLTEDEVESIKRWSKTKSGCKEIIIVRKMPFALFISIGTILFALLEVLMF